MTGGDSVKTFVNRGKLTNSTTEEDRLRRTGRLAE